MWWHYTEQLIQCNIEQGVLGHVARWNEQTFSAACAVTAMPTGLPNKICNIIYETQNSCVGEPSD